MIYYMILYFRYFYRSIFLFPCCAISHDIARRGCYCTGVIARALGLCGILATTCALIRINALELLGTLCGKRQDTALVWIINILLHSLACIFQLLHANSCNKVYI